jgi:hypothetical protein
MMSGGTPAEMHDHPALPLEIALLDGGTDAANHFELGVVQSLTDGLACRHEPRWKSPRGRQWS